MEKNNVIQNAHSVILSAHHVILSVAKNLFLIVIAANLLASCQKAGLIDIQGGEDVEEETLTALPAITFRAVNTTDDVVKINLPEGGDFTSVKVIAEASKPVSMTESVSLDVDESLVEKYNQKNKTEAVLLPSPFYKIEDGGVISIPSGAIKSDEKLVRIYATNPLGNVLEAGVYLLPLTASSGETVYVEVTVQAPFSGRPELYTGEDFFTVLYLNTSEYDPRLVTDYVVQKLSPMSEPLWSRSVGNILNLRHLSIDLDKTTSTPFLYISQDMRYVLDHADVFLRPIQESGRKVCLCIEAAYSTIGFCSLDDEEIRSFVNTVKDLVTTYSLDGINLWDRNRAYNDGNRKLNTTSYPNLIKKMREALGPHKILTLTDFEAPTEYFWDEEATGGIKVGDYIDYAWSGYYSVSEPVQYIDPYHTSKREVSQEHVRKPIANLSYRHWGAIMVDRRNSTDYRNTLKELVINGDKLNDIYVAYDVETYLQGKLEGVFSIVELMKHMDPHYYDDSPITYMMDGKNFFNYSQE